MNVNHDNVVDKAEFIEYVFKAFKNCEDNIEFLANDIKDFDEKIDEVKQRLEQVKTKERKTGY
jgi:prefoldin subunit 5